MALAPLALMALGWPVRAAMLGAEQGAQTSRLKTARQEVSAPPARHAVVDDAGRRVEVPMVARRVVSLAPSVTETLYAVGAGSQIAGITDYSDVPKGSPAKPSVGEPLDPSIEEIVSLRPDLVLVDGSINRWETVASLDRLNIPVYATDARTVEGMLETIRRIAGLVGAQRAGDRLASRLEARLDALRQRLAGRKPKRVLFVVWQDPLITTGKNTFIADALRWAGAESVIDVNEDWPHVSMEEIVHLEPEELIFPATGAMSAATIAQALGGQPGWRELEAVRKGRLVLVSDAINRPSPALVGAIEELARELHPGAFRADTPIDAGGEARDGEYSRHFRAGTGSAAQPRRGGST